MHEVVKSGKRMGQHRYEKMLDAIIDGAGLGDYKHIDTCFDRTQGRPAQSVMLEGSSESPLQVIEHVIVESKNAR